MRTGFSKILATFLLSTTLLVTVPALVRAAESELTSSQAVQIQSFKTHSRLVLAIDESVETQWKSGAQGFELFLKGIGLADLGAPLGEEAQWSARYSQLHDPRLASLSFREVPGGVKIEGTWKFPSGREALAKPVMETFDFHKNSPAQYVLDFWAKEGPTVAEEADRKKNASKRALLSRADAASKDRLGRRLASDQARAEMEDITRFCHEPLTDTTDIFVPFVPLHEKVKFSRWFPANSPDNDYEYFLPEKSDEKDAQYVRLALSLYREGKTALVLRTLDFMATETPNSPMRHEMKFLRANAMLRLGMQDEGEKMLKNLLSDEKDSPVSLLAGEYLAAKLFERGNYLQSTEKFQWLIEHYATNRLNWVFHLGIAESLYALRQTERAAKEYQWVIENATENVDKAEAALRQGDLYLERLQYDQGLASYFQGLNYFKNEAKNFPAIYINRAESLYGLAQYDRAKEAFETFLKNFPGHPAGWRATFRIGEIEGRKAGEEARASSRHWFYETINHYPVSPGATLARLRLVPCGDHAGFSADATERFFDNEVASYNGSGQIGMLKFHPFQAIAHVRTLVALGRDPDAVELATEELRAPTASPELRAILGTTVGPIFRKSILTLLEKGKKYEALSLYDDKYAEIPKPDLKTDTDYLMKLSQAAADLGLSEVAARIAESQKKADAAVKLAAEEAAGGAKTAEAAAGSRDIEADLRGSEKNFTQAKSLFVGLGGQPDTKAEGKIRELLMTVKSESSFSYERELMLGLMDERKKELPTALAHAVRAQMLAPRPGGPAAGEPAVKDYRLESWLASLQARVGDFAAAFESYRNIENHLNLENADTDPRTKGPRVPAITEIFGVPPVPSMAGVLIAEGEIQEKLGHWGEAAATYSRAMESGVGGDQVVYGYARALLKTGAKEDREKGYTVLRDLAAGKIKVPTDARKPAADPNGAGTDNFWKKLAREALENERSRQEVLGNGNQGGLKSD